jgi:HPt (histidine-containing phosphotransfer) domain-containing protein
MNEPTLDAAVYRELQETAGAEFAAELAGTFLEEAPLMLAEARRAFAAGDAAGLARAAHSLKSNALTFGAAELAALARALELSPLAQVDATALDALDAAHARAHAALEALRHV